MRIVGGQYRGRILKGPKQNDLSTTRPTSDRVRESLFNILAPHIRGARFLDLFAGTGAVGIEAISRGASQLTLVERDRYMSQIIKDNLTSLDIKAELLPIDVFRALNQLTLKGCKFDIIFADPPYHLMAASKLVELVEPLLNEGGLFVIEHGKEEKIEQEILIELKHYIYGESIISLYLRR